MLLSFFFFSFFSFFQLFLGSTGNSHRDPRQRKKRGGGREEGKGEKPAGVAQPTGCRGRRGGARGVWGGGTAISHTHARTHTLPKGLGGGRSGRDQSSLKTSVLLLMH